LLGASAIAGVSLVGKNIADSLQVAKRNALDDYYKNPGDWEKVGERTEPATGKDYKGGKSVEERYRNKKTGQEIERHRISDPNGKSLHDHWRLMIIGDIGY
jgi:hypothetical protein